MDLMLSASQISHDYVCILFQKTSQPLKRSLIMGAVRPIGRGRAKLIDNLRDKDASVAPGRKTVVLKFSKSLKGKLVGKGGSKIKELREVSGAGIDLSEEGEEVVVTIRGTGSQVEKAKELVESLTSIKEEAINGCPGIPVWGSVKYGGPVEEEMRPSELGNSRSQFTLFYIPLYSFSSSCYRLGLCK